MPPSHGRRPPTASTLRSLSPVKPFTGLLDVKPKAFMPVQHKHKPDFSPVPLVRLPRSSSVA